MTTIEALNGIETPEGYRITLSEDGGLIEVEKNFSEDGEDWDARGSVVKNGDSSASAGDDSAMVMGLLAEAALVAWDQE